MVIPNDFLLLVTKQKPWGCEDHIVFSAKKTREGFHLLYIQALKQEPNFGAKLNFF